MSCYKVNPNKYDLTYKAFWLDFTTSKIFFQSFYIFEFLVR
jgi:hypothetical protein